MYVCVYACVCAYVCVPNIPAVIMYMSHTIEHLSYTGRCGIYLLKYLKEDWLYQ